MTLTILTPTGTAHIKDCASVTGKKALVRYLDRMRIDRTPFVVLPPKTCATDLHEVTSALSIESYD